MTTNGAEKKRRMSFQVPAEIAEAFHEIGWAHRSTIRNSDLGDVIGASWVLFMALDQDMQAKLIRATMNRPTGLTPNSKEMRSFSRGRLNALVAHMRVHKGKSDQGEVNKK